jgi:hypothetical protein
MQLRHGLQIYCVMRPLASVVLTKNSDVGQVLASSSGENCELSDQWSWLTGS